VLAATPGRALAERPVRAESIDRRGATTQ